MTGLDVSALWTDGSATSDISDAGLDLWFFSIPNSFIPMNIDRVLTPRRLFTAMSLYLDPSVMDS